MIISHKHKFIFFHTRKVAGSSIKVNLNNILGKDDIIIGSANEILDQGFRLPDATARRIFSISGSIGYLTSRCLFKKHRKSYNNGIKASFYSKLGLNPAHPDARLVKKYFQNEFDTYTKIGFVRDPWEQVYSDFNWRSRTTGRTKVNFSDFVDDLYYGRNFTGLIPYGLIPNWNIIAIEDEVILNKVGRFENLKNDFNEFFAPYGANGGLINSAKKSGLNSSGYARFYSKKSKMQVSEMFSKEIEIFKYRFIGDINLLG